MNALLKELLQMPEARALLDSTLRRDKPMVTGVSPVHRAMLAAAMFQETGRPMLLLCGDETEAMKLSGDLHALTGQNVTLLRRRDWQLRPSAAASRSWRRCTPWRGARHRWWWPPLTRRCSGVCRKVCCWRVPLP